MIKEDIIRNTMNQLHLDRNSSKDVVEKTLDIIKESLAVGENIMVSGFGQFRVSQKESRVGRNPKSGKEYQISARKVVTFYVSKVFRRESGKA